MAYKTLYKDITFIEGKDVLVKEAKLKNCNYIINFEYGQKTSLFSLDDNKWY